MSLIRVDYAGPGGTCEGMRMLGLEPVGIEWDAAACATRAAAGHLTIRADLATYRPHHEPGSVWGYWASPPCQTFSTAGKGAGRDQIDGLVSVIDREDWAAADTLDPRTRHVVDAARTAVELRPEWVCMEQVPPAQPVFEAIARRLRTHGYSVWVGVLNCADYGIPQTRRRVILMASRVRAAHPPEPTHSADPVDGLFGTTEPWVSMADALGWPTSFEVKGRRGEGMTERHGDRPATPATEPYPTVTGGAHRRHWVVDRRTNSRGPGGTIVPTVPVPVSEPSPTLTGMAGGQWIIRSGSTVNGGELAELTVEDALILQSFRSDYPVQGTKTKKFEQVGNAVPPVLSMKVVGAITGAAS